MSAPAPLSGSGLPPWRVALVHDWLTGMRGGERTLDALCEIFPQAPLHTMVHVPGTVSAAIEARRVEDSLLRYIPQLPRFYRHLLPLFPSVVESFDQDVVDLVLSTSHCAVKSVIVPPHACHVCYCFTPMRYAWDQFDAYFGRERLGLWSPLARLAMGGLARWDRATSHRVTRYVAISQYVAQRIALYYNRSSVVVYPPVDTTFFHPAATAADGTYFLVVSALVPYKRLELAIEACRRHGTPLRIVGQGPELARLKRDAGSGTAFLGVCSDEEIRDLYRGARAVLLPGEEDFGIVPVEAQACGRPVVALGRGGALETIVDGQTGVLVPEPTVDAFAAGLLRVDRLDLDRAVIRAHALAFSRERFQAEMVALIAETMQQYEERQAS